MIVHSLVFADRSWDGRRRLSKKGSVRSLTHGVAGVFAALVAQACQPVKIENSGLTPLLTLSPDSDVGVSDRDRITNKSAVSLAIQAPPSVQTAVKLTRKIVGDDEQRSEKVITSDKGSAEVVFSDLSEGIWVAVAQTMDRDGKANHSKELQFTVDLTPPRPAMVTFSGDVDLVTQNVASARRLSIKGEAHASVVITLGNTQLKLVDNAGLGGAGTAVVNISSGVSLAIDTAYPITITTTDRAGNKTISEETIVIGRPELIFLAPESDLGTSASDRVTSARILMFDVQGQAAKDYEVVAVAQIDRSETSLGKVTLDANGMARLKDLQEISAGLEDGLYTISLRESDSSGREVASVSVNLDRAAPSSASIRLLGSDEGLITDQGSKVQGFALSGGEPNGGAYAISIGGVSVVSYSPDARSLFNGAGMAELTLTNAQRSSLDLQTGLTYALTLTTYDRAGNSVEAKLVLDTSGGKAPPVPVLVFPSDVDSSADGVSLSSVRGLREVIVHSDAKSLGGTFVVRLNGQHNLATFTIESVEQRVDLTRTDVVAPLSGQLSVDRNYVIAAGKAKPLSEEKTYTLSIPTSVDLATESDRGTSSTDNLTNARVWMLEINTIAQTIPGVVLRALDSSSDKPIQATVTSVSRANADGLATAQVTIDEASLINSQRMQDWQVVVTHEGGWVEDAQKDSFTVKFDARLPVPLVIAGDTDPTNNVALVFDDVAQAMSVSISGSAGGVVRVYQGSDETVPVATAVIGTDSQGTLDLSRVVKEGTSLLRLTSTSESGEKGIVQELSITIADQPSQSAELSRVISDPLGLADTFVRTDRQEFVELPDVLPVMRDDPGGINVYTEADEVDLDSELEPIGVVGFTEAQLGG